MKHLGWPAILAIAVVGIVLAGLGGALIANATTRRRFGAGRGGTSDG